MRAFGYERATDPAGAVAAVASYDASPAAARDGRGARFIAGGTNLLDLMKLDVERPAHLVDVTRLALDRIEPTPDGGLRIGTLVRNSVLASDPAVRARYGVLSRALLAGATGQLRNKATTGGNLLQRTRCDYFSDVTRGCNKRQPGTGCSAIGGYNRGLAVLGASPSCIATYPGDMGVAMRLLDATVVTERAGGAGRTIPIASFHRLPGTSPERDTVLETDELITHVVLPAPVPGTHLYRKVRDRHSYAFALVSVAAIVERDGDRIGRARFAFGGLSAKPWRVEAAEAMLAGKPATDAVLAAAADRALDGARGYGSNDFKIPLARRTFASVIREAMA